MHVELSRGDVCESSHQVDVVIAGLAGPLVVWGEPDRPVIPRSAIKFVQAVPLLRTGAAETFEVSNTELILACSSHSAEPPHVEAIRAWLERIGLDVSALECGPSLPIGDEAQLEIIRGGRGEEPILNCCSGKHTGFLTVARHLGVDPAGYIEPDHPVQRLVTAAIEEFTGSDLSAQQPGRDGCGIPTFAIPLSDLASAMSLLASPERLDGSAATAASRLVEAAVDSHFWISGSGRREVILAAAIDEPLMVKAGAEGVFMAGLPGRGLGIAVKARDGASRAAEAAISAALAWVGALPDDQVGWPLTNKAGDRIGAATVAVPEPVLNRL